MPGTKETATDCLHAEARTGEERQNLRGARRRGGGRSGTDALQERSYKGIAEVTAAITIRNRTTNIFGKIHLSMKSIMAHFLVFDIVNTVQ